MATEKLEVQITLDDGSVIKGFTNVEKGALKAGKKAGKGFETGLKSATTNFAAGLGRDLLALGAAFGSLQAVGGVLKSVRNLDTAFAEIKTIIPDVSQANQELRQSFVDLSGQFGTSAAEQAKSFYSIVSAGITDTVQAQELLLTANRLAVGGLTDVNTAIDVLTSSINAYGAENLSAQQASDVLFGTVRLGKTRIEELAASLGQVLPTASTLKVSFQDTNAALAALTTRGISTSQAVTQLNAVFTAVLSKQDAAKKLGKEVADAFKLQSLQSKGLTKFLFDLNNSLGGSERALTQLIGSAEGARAILTLAGDGFKTLDNNVNQLNNSLGSSTEAFNKVNDTIGQQLEQLGSKIVGIFTSIGDSSTGALVDLLKNLNSFVDSVGKNIGVIGSLLGQLTRLTLSFLAAQKLMPIVLNSSVFSLKLFGNALKTFAVSLINAPNAIRGFITQVRLIPIRLQLARLSLQQFVVSLKNFKFSTAIAGFKGLASSIKASSIALKGLRVAANLAKAAFTLGLTFVIDELINQFMKLKEGFGGLGNLIQFTVLKIKQSFNELLISSIDLIKGLEKIPVLGDKFKSAFGTDLAATAASAKKNLQDIQLELDNLNQKVFEATTGVDLNSLTQRPEQQQMASDSSLPDVDETQLMKTRERIESSLDAMTEKTRKSFADQGSVAQAAWSSIAEMIGSNVGRIQFSLQDLEIVGRKAFANIAAAATEGFARSFAAIGDALVKGENAFAAFGKAILGVLGDVAIQAGTVYFLLGIASYNPQQVAAGLALIVLGGALKALAGGGGGAASVGGGGGLASNPVDGNESPIQNQTQNPGAQVSVNIQGDVLDGEETGLRISNIIKDQFGANGVVIT